MTKTGKRELLLELRPLYLRAGKVEKGRLLDQFVAATKYHRKYAAHLFVHGPRVHSDAARRGRTPYGPVGRMPAQASPRSIWWLIAAIAPEMSISTP